MISFRVKILFLLITSFWFFAFPLLIKAQPAAPAGAAAVVSSAESAIASAALACDAEALAKALAATQGCTFANGTGTCGPALLSVVEGAIRSNDCQNILITESNQIKILADDVREIEKQTWRDVLAGAWKAMVKAFTRQVAYDTASWIASGGKGQKPLFITEGIGAYLKNTADDAAGAFIDELDKEFGVNLCRPNFNVELLIKTSLRGERIRKPSCNFTQMVNNWQSAIRDANFSVEYSNYLNASENDIGIYLKTQSSLMDRVKEKTGVSALEALINNGFKDLKTLTGWILTPGTMVREQHNQSQERAGKEDTFFTGTIWDFVETFLNTLIAQLLQNLKDGYFKDGTGGGGSGLNLPNLSRFTSLLNPEAAPYIEGSIGSASRFARLVENTITVGGPYDILNKLTNCTDAAKTNPGPTDCVMDQILAQAIRDKKLLKDLPPAILNRPFVPPIDNVNPQEAFTLRNIIILRKYRIVPVGWEIAARYIANYEKDKTYTLGDLMNFYKSGPIFKDLVDPQWVLKAPELYCRREGYGDHNKRADLQSGVLSRSKYCADEQQCVQEDANGNCTAYGYCTEEKRVWDFKATSCEPRFNTCQTFQDRSGATGSYLANTLDYQNCDSQNVGCRWYSALYNPLDGYWLSTEKEKVLKVCSNQNGCEVDGLAVPQWQQTASLASSRTVMSEICQTTGGCDFTGESCVIPYNGVKCSIDKCQSEVNSLTALNSGFELQGTAVWDARFWSEGYQDANNRQFRSAVDKRTGAYSLQSITFSNPNPIETTLPVPTGLEATTNYKLTFYARGNIGQGNISIKVYAGSSELGSYRLGAAAGSWQNYSFNFSTQDNSNLAIKIIAEANTLANIFFDDFDLRAIPQACATNSVILTLGTTNETDSEIYFDRDAGACNSSSAGCSQFIRTKAGLGSNLVYNSGFEEGAGETANGWAFANYVSGVGEAKRVSTPGTAHSGAYAASLKYISGEWTYEKPIFDLEAGSAYILSAWVKLNSSNAVATNIGADLYIKSSATLISGNGAKLLANSVAGVWHRVEKKFIASSNYTNVYIRLLAGFPGEIIYFDDVKLEKVSAETTSPTAYTAYSPNERPASQLAYLKKAPAYDDCYLTGSGNWPANLTQLQAVIAGRQAACANYSSVCIKDEMNCELYTPVNGDPPVPGTITSADLCPQECAGYQVYKQEPTTFTSAKYEQFIAKAPIQSCPASAAGCDEFTNLDEVERGGEALEYYTRLRVCQQPDAYTDKATYYTWEGNDTTGYQLKVFGLKKSNSSNAPCTNLSYGNNGVNFCADPTAGDSDLDGLQNYDDPNQNLGACTAGDLNSNPDCREFYDTTGTIHYRLLSKVIYVDDNCHPYRRTQTQNELAEAAQDCRNSAGYWNNNNECIYMAIPKQGGACSLNQKGCREYTGNRGNSFINILLADFESGSMGWQGGTVAAESTHPGGLSLTNALNNSRKFSKPVLIKKNRTYVLSFWAKGGGAGSKFDSIKFSDAPSAASFIAGSPAVVSDLGLPLSDQWDRYDLGPVFVNWSNATNYFEQNLEFNIPRGQTVYIDNILLKELPQSLYAVANSWFTPFSCDNNFDQPSGAGDAVNPVRSQPGKMIGCEEYRDRANQNWFLKSFENLCRADAVGCEQLIDTHNSDSYSGATFNGGDSSQLTVPQDELIYMVNDAKYSCKSEDKGCTAYGRPNINSQNEVVSSATVYLKNQPDSYSTILCQASALWCEEFVGSRNVSYFKNPRDRVCDYRTLAGELAAKWYKKGTTEICDVTYLQTLGNGNKADKVQPIGWFNSSRVPSANLWPVLYGRPATSYDNWVGLCPTAQSSCSEYIDPLTTIYKNEILNADLSQNVDANNGDTTPDHWTVGGGGYFQNLTLKTHILYSFSANHPANPTLANSVHLEKNSSCSGVIITPDASLKIEAGTTVLPLAGSQSGRFYIVSSADTCQIKVILPTTQKVDNLKIVQAGVYYALSNKVNYTSCNGLVDYNSGCALFNDRGVINYSSANSQERNAAYLTYDADATYVAQQADPDQKPQTPSSVTSPVTGNSNVILKVQPDRACSNWLYCTTYEKNDPNSTDPIYGTADRCLDLGLCASVNAKGICNNFILKSGDPTAESYTLADANKTGYSYVGGVVGADPANQQTIPGYFPYYLMSQFGNAGSITNGNFESVVSGSSEPYGWENIDLPGLNAKAEAVGWHDYKFSVVTDIKNSPEGGRYLKLNSFYEALSEEIDVFPGQQYVLAGWINSANIDYPDGNVIVKPQILYQEHISGGNWDEITITDQQLKGWKYGSELTIDAGLPWTKVMKEITIGAKVDKIRLKLKNYVPDDDCNDYNKASNCELGGSSFFDDISLKPVLEVSDSAITTEKYLTRSCRLYPAEDSLSCRYIANNKLYYGNYGFCLVKDPKNAKQCLQWWPVDQLEGEILNEVGGYNDRLPLDYCTEKKKFNVGFSESGNALTLSSRAQEVTAGFFDSNSGNQMKFSPIRIKDDYQPLFRFPYVDRIKLIVNGIGFYEYSLFFMIPVFHDITYDTVNQEWKGWAAIPVCVGPKGGAGGICMAIPIPYDIAVGPLGKLIAGLSATVNPSGRGFALGPLMTIKIITDKQIGNITGGGATDPIPDLDGDILGAAWSVDSTPSADVVLLTMNVNGNFDVNYCNKLVRVVTSSGTNKAYANRVSPGSGFINEDKYARPDTLPYPNDTEVGKYYYYDPFDYNKFLDSATSIIYNGGTDCSANDIICSIISGAVDLITSTIGQSLGNLFPNGDNLSPLEQSTYQSSDYQPFGAIVSPPGSPTPSNWSSRKGIYNTPLLYEPPRLGGFPASYQARMGEVHSQEGLEELFAQSYGAWKWKWNACIGGEGCRDSNGECKTGAGLSDFLCQGPITDRGGVYVKDDSGVDFLTIPNTLCTWPADTTSFTRASSTESLNNQPCYIAPRITSIKVNPDPNGQSNTDIGGAESGGVGLAKLAFSTLIDPDQLPITAYTINWGDGEQSKVSGVTLRNRANPANPFLLYHLYDFWKVKSANQTICDNDNPEAVTNAPCCKDSFCRIPVQVTIYDNWNKFNAPGTGNIDITVKK